MHKDLRSCVPPFALQDEPGEDLALLRDQVEREGRHACGGAKCSTSNAMQFDLAASHAGVIA